jgi:hypothetical protein
LLESTPASPPDPEDRRRAEALDRRIAESANAGASLRLAAMASMLRAIAESAKARASLHIAMAPKVRAIAESYKAWASLHIAMASKARAIAESDKVPSVRPAIPPRLTTPYLESLERKPMALEAPERTSATLEAEGLDRAAALETLGRVDTALAAREWERVAKGRDPDRAFLRAPGSGLAPLQERERERAASEAQGATARDAYRKVPSVRALERKHLDGVHDEMEITARKLSESKICGPWEIRPDRGGRRSLWVEWLVDPEGFERRRRRPNRPPS